MDRRLSPHVFFSEFAIAQWPGAILSQEAGFVEKILAGPNSNCVAFLSADFADGRRSVMAMHSRTGAILPASVYRIRPALLVLDRGCHLEPWLFQAAAHHFAIDDVDRRFRATLADADGVTLRTGVHFRQKRANLVFGFTAERAIQMRRHKTSIALCLPADGTKLMPLGRPESRAPHAIICLRSAIHDKSGAQCTAFHSTGERT